VYFSAAIESAAVGKKYIKERYGPDSRNLKPVSSEIFAVNSVKRKEQIPPEETGISLLHKER
jgi:hypothetical protein